MMSGGRRRPVEPSQPWISLPQMPQARTRTNTSSSAGRGSGASTSSRQDGAVSNKAFTGYAGCGCDYVRPFLSPRQGENVRRNARLVVAPGRGRPPQDKEKRADPKVRRVENETGSELSSWLRRLSPRSPERP